MVIGSLVSQGWLGRPLEVDACNSPILGPKHRSLQINQVSRVVQPFLLKIEARPVRWSHLIIPFKEGCYLSIGENHLACMPQQEL